MKVKSILEVEILLWYAYAPEDFPNLDAPTIKEVIYKYLQLGLLLVNEVGNTKYKANPEAINAYVEAVINVPLPKQAWIVSYI